MDLLLAPCYLLPSRSTVSPEFNFSGLRCLILKLKVHNSIACTFIQTRGIMGWAGRVIGGRFMPKVRLEDREKFSTGHLATLIQASRTTVVRWIEEGRLRARRSVGGWYVIPRDEVVSFLWDLSFSKETPLRIWRAATLAYEEMSKPRGEAKPDRKKPGKKK